MSATEQRRATVEAAVQLGLTPDEYAKICEIQGGEPTYVELAIYSLMWSEHCSYKHSRPILGRFPTSGPRILQGPGENAGTPFTQAAEPGDVLRIVVKHNEGNYRVDPATLGRMRDNGQIVLRYCAPDGSARRGPDGEPADSSPNGSLDDIAGVCNEGFNVFGMMPHPENSVEADLAGGTDGRVFFASIVQAVLEKVTA